MDGESVQDAIQFFPFVGYNFTLFGGSKRILGCALSGDGPLDDDGLGIHFWSVCEGSFVGESHGDDRFAANSVAFLVLARYTHSAPFRMRSLIADPRPVIADFPPSAIATPVRTADFPPCDLSRHSELSFDTLTAIVSYQEVHLRAKVQSQVAMAHKVDQADVLDVAGLADLLAE